MTVMSKKGRQFYYVICEECLNVTFIKQITW